MRYLVGTPGPDGVPGSIATTWQTSFEQLGERPPLAAQRLPGSRRTRCLSRCSKSPFPVMRRIQAPLHALAELKAYSLATRAADAPLFSGCIS